MNSVLEDDVLRKLFPTVMGARKLCRASRVHYLIGLSKVSWQPDRALKAEGGGDFRLWQNNFGSCIGGSNPLVNAHVS